MTEQSCNLIGALKFLSSGPRILSKFTRPYSSLEVGSGDETRGYVCVWGGGGGGGSSVIRAPAHPLPAGVLISRMNAVVQCTYVVQMVDISYKSPFHIR